MDEIDMKRMATSIKIDPDLWKQTKIAAINFGTTASELVETAIREYIKRKKEIDKNERQRKSKRADDDSKQSGCGV